MSLREFKKILPSTLIYDSILKRKKIMNANIMNTQILYLIKYDLKGHIRSLLGFKIHFC